MIDWKSSQEGIFPTGTANASGFNAGSLKLKHMTPGLISALSRGDSIKPGMLPLYIDMSFSVY